MKVLFELGGAGILHNFRENVKRRLQSLTGNKLSMYLVTAKCLILFIAPLNMLKEVTLVGRRTLI